MRHNIKNTIRKVLSIYNRIMGISIQKFRGYIAAEYLIKEFDFNSVIDVGAGAGEASDYFIENGKTVTSVDFGKSIYYNKRDKNSSHEFIIGDFMDIESKEEFDLVWCSHVLEHQPNVIDAISKLFSFAKEGGLVCITVPPLKHTIVGGHLSLWNAGLLLYNVVFSGFDASHARVKKYGYNISIIFIKETIRGKVELHYDSGDINRLKKYFPSGLSEGFNGDIEDLNW